jgi:hypothetical protein
MATIFDHRSNSKEKPVWEVAIDQMSWTAAGGHAALTETIGLNGQITQIVFVIGDGGVADPNVVFEIQDADGNIMFTTTENDNQTVIDVAGGDFADNQLTMNNFIVSADPDAAPTVSMTVDVTLRGI